MKRLTRGCVRLMERFLPDAFVLAIIITVIVFIATMCVTRLGPVSVLYSWVSGFWGLLSFAMQMALIVIVGGTMAKAPVVKRFLGWIAHFAKTPVQAVVITCVISVLTQYLQSGFSLIFCALLAKEMARKVKGVDYRILIAAGYSGICVCQAGLGGSILLSLAQPGYLAAYLPTFTGSIPISETIFNMQSIICCLAILVALPIVFRFMMPKKEDTVVVDPKLLEEKEMEEFVPETPAEKIECSKILWAFIWIAGLFAFVYSLVFNGLDINAVIFAMFFLGILFHGNLKNYINAFMESVGSGGSIILQFPFYAGISGMMLLANDKGVSVASALTNALINISTVRTFPIWSWLSASILNIFVPSGGGQWAVQAPIILPAAEEMGVSITKASLSVLWGDAWTNLIQPFWALPALAVAGLKARDIMGFLVPILIVSGIIIGLCLFFIP